MGRGVVLSEIGAGQYTVREEIDTATIVTRLAELNSTVASAQAEIVLLQAERANVQIELNIALNSIDASIAAGDVEADLQLRVNAAGRIRAQLDEIDRQINRVSLAVTAAEAQIVELNTYLSVSRDRIAWAADYTEGIAVSTVVGLIDPGRATRNPLIIQPSRNATDYVYDGARDGILSPAVVAPPNTFFINHVKSPAAIRWRARYRVGSIQTIDGGSDTCSVQMDAVNYNVLDAGINGLLPRNTETLTSVPIDYLTCNSAAFSIGSRVVVEFDAQGADPVVVGFETNPQECDASAAIAGLLGISEVQLVGGARFIRFNVSDFWVFDDSPAVFASLVTFVITLPTFPSPLLLTNPFTLYRTFGTESISFDPSSWIEGVSPNPGSPEHVLDNTNGPSDAVMVNQYLYDDASSFARIRVTYLYANAFGVPQSPLSTTGSPPVYPGGANFFDGDSLLDNPFVNESYSSNPNAGGAGSTPGALQNTLEFQTCTTSLGDGSYTWALPVNYSVLQFNFSRHLIDFATVPVGTIVIVGVISGAQLTFDIPPLACRVPDGTNPPNTQDFAVVNNGLLYNMRIFPASSLQGGRIFVSYNFTSLPTSATGAAPPFPNSVTPDNYGFSIQAGIQEPFSFTVT